MCKHLEEVDITNGVKTIGAAAFSECSSLKSFNTGISVTTILDDVFYGSALEKVILGESLISLGKSVFNECHYLDRVECRSIEKSDKG